MTEIHPLKQAIELVGLGPLAKGLGLTYPAIRKWERAGRLPRTEWTGETNYAGQIAVLTDNRVTKAQLLGKWPELAISEEKQPTAVAGRAQAATESVAVQGGAAGSMRDSQGGAGSGGLNQPYLAPKGAA